MIRALEIGKRALLASQRGLDVTSNNIANVNTPSYARQQVVLRPGESIPVGGMMVGMGVLTSSIRQFRDHLIERDLRNYTSSQNYYQQDATILQRIEQILGEPGEQTLQTALQRFFDAAAQLSAQPSNIATRRLFAARASELAAQFNSTARGIEQLRNTTFEQATTSVERVNFLLDAIAKSNANIHATIDASGQPAASLLDQQAALLDELSRYIDISITRDATGSISVTSGGMMLVTSNAALSLQVQKQLDGTTGATTLKFIVQKPDGTTVGTFIPQNGELASLTKHYNETLNPQSTSGDFSIARELDRFAATFAERVNRLAITGFGLSDSGPVPPGREIFISSSPGPITAVTLSINPLLTSDPATIPTSGVPNAPGNNAVIAAIAALATDSTFLDGTTPEGYYGILTSRLAHLHAGTNDRLTATKTMVEQVTTERSSLSGVNLDEEATNLIVYQRSFEAAARIVTATSEMLATLVNLGR
ncbi:MAG: flagellar hook-associated protein FlgK [Chlorobi bacterium]|nr:flagellar hook-associated protein FlgK [Chlorobiota bacterium]